VDKLTCRLRAGAEGAQQPVVLLGCGSFNPPTLMHLRMFEAARAALTQEGLDVLGGYLSPVNDAYGKQGLAAAEQRVAMCKAAVASSSWLMVSPWEARAPSYQRSLTVLQHLQSELDRAIPQVRLSARARPTDLVLEC